MYSLPEQLITEKKIQRQVKLLKQLKSSPYPLSVDDLMDTYSVSYKTIQNDLTELHELFINKDSLNFDSFSNISLTITDDELQQIFYKLTNSVMSFQLLDYLFTNPSIKMEEFEMQFFVSEATLKRHVSKWRSVLKRFYLNIKLTPIRITGKEENIRFFYFHYFREVVKLHKTFVPNESHLDATNFLTTTLENKLKQNLLVDFQKLSFWIMVVESRIRTHGRYTFEKNISSVPFKLNYIEFYGETSTTMFKNFFMLNITPYKDEVMYGYGIFLDSIVYKDYLFEEPYSSLSKSTTRNDLEAFLNEIKEQIEIESLVFVSASQNYFSVLLFLSQISPLFQKSDPRLTMHIRKSHPTTFAKWFNFLIDSTARKRLGIEYVEETCTILTIYTILYLYEENKEDPTVLFAFQGEQIFLEYISLISSKAFYNVNKLFLLGEPVSETLLLDTKIDLIISNYPIPKVSKEIRTITLSAIPTIEEWQTVHNEILNIVTTLDRG